MGIYRALNVPQRWPWPPQRLTSVHIFMFSQLDRELVDIAKGKRTRTIYGDRSTYEAALAAERKRARAKK